MPRLGRLLRMQLHRSAAAQVALLTALWWGASQLGALARLPLPGSILGMLLLLGLVGGGVLPVRWIRQGASLLLGHLVLFLIPPMLALIEHPDLLSLVGLKLLGAILLGTLVVMAGTAKVIDLCLARSTHA
ncbi:CidA/LrgA family protein [Roseomonas sp. 18066]|uniref:CidA/LrgA family protein n=1 Tax=Roseomonas sp. 18066 TaxID=2681412 RepID=UPI0013598434|nr:CidA/LrgA family protein [Roseomonas sp. 18066]